MSVQDDSGNTVGSPVVVGKAGQKVQVRLVCEDNPQVERMRVTLDPQGIEDGQLLYSYELSVPGHLNEQQHGTVKLAMGHEHRIHLRPAGSKGVLFTLSAEPLKKYLAHRRPMPRPIVAS